MLYVNITRPFSSNQHQTSCTTVNAQPTTVEQKPPHNTGMLLQYKTTANAIQPYTGHQNSAHCYLKQQEDKIKQVHEGWASSHNMDQMPAPNFQKELNKKKMIETTDAKVKEYSNNQNFSSQYTDTLEGHPHQHTYSKYAVKSTSHELAAESSKKKLTSNEYVIASHVREICEQSQKIIQVETAKNIQSYSNNEALINSDAGPSVQQKRYASNISKDQYGSISKFTTHPTGIDISSYNASAPPSNSVHEKRYKNLQ